MIFGLVRVSQHHLDRHRDVAAPVALVDSPLAALGDEALELQLVRVDPPRLPKHNNNMPEIHEQSHSHKTKDKLTVWCSAFHF